MISFLMEASVRNTRDMMGPEGGGDTLRFVGLPLCRGWGREEMGTGKVILHCQLWQVCQQDWPNSAKASCKAIGVV